MITPQIFPETMEELLFGEKFNQPFFPDVLPKNITVLKFGNDQNHTFKLNVLPPRLTNLCFGDSFNQIFEKDVLPPTLLVLNVGYHYNHSKENNFLPDSLRITTIKSQKEIDESKRVEEMFMKDCVSQNLNNQQIFDNEIIDHLDNQNTLSSFNTYKYIICGAFIGAIIGGVYGFFRYKL